MTGLAAFDEEFRIEEGFPTPLDDFWIPVMGCPAEDGWRLASVCALMASRTAVFSRLNS